MTFRLICADVMEGLRELPDRSVNCCITSPPYFGLRDYGVDGQIGMEPTPEEYTERLVSVFREVRRVLRGDGTLWLNLGDSFNAHPGQRKITDKVGPKQQTNRGASGAPSRHVGTLKPKDIIGIPWRVAFAIQADGWYLRSDIIWHKPNPMPESVTDRPTKAHEYLFLLTKSLKYYYDHEAIKEAATYPGDQGFLRGPVDGCDSPSISWRAKSQQSRKLAGVDSRSAGSDKRNRRSVWTVAPTPYKQAHFAVMPEGLVEPCVLAGCPDGGMVLDPFAGSGTVGVVALRHGRNFIGIELNPQYVELAARRISNDAPLLNEQVA